MLVCMYIQSVVSFASVFSVHQQNPTRGFFPYGILSIGKENCKKKKRGKTNLSLSKSSIRLYAFHIPLII